MTKDSRVTIIGAGQAGLACAARLRALGHQGPVTLIGDEPALPYQRPPLSKAHLDGSLPSEKLALRPAQFYADQRIALITGQRVTRIGDGAVTLGDKDLAFDHLVLATGATARALPQVLSGNHPLVHVLRDIADSDRLRPELRAGRHLLVIGGGFIGLEVAASARKLGLEVTLIEAAPRILERALAPESSDQLRQLHLSRGVTLIEGAALDSLRPEGTGMLAQLSDGRQIQADLVLAGIGAVPRTELAQDLGLDCAQGIAVDALCQTARPGIWAAGDCAAILHEGRRMRIESVGNAIDMGDCVAANILGAAQPYRPKPWFWSDQYELKLQIAGLGTGHDQLIRRAPQGGAASHWYLRQGRLVAVDSFGDPRSHMIARRLVPEAPAVAAGLLEDSGFDPKSLLDQPR